MPGLRRARPGAALPGLFPGEHALSPLRRPGSGDHRSLRRLRRRGPGAQVQEGEHPHPGRRGRRLQDAPFRRGRRRPPGRALRRPLRGAARGAARILPAGRSDRVSASAALHGPGGPGLHRGDPHHPRDEQTGDSGGHTERRPLHPARSGHPRTARRPQGRHGGGGAGAHAHPAEQGAEGTAAALRRTGKAPRGGGRLLQQALRPPWQAQG